MNSTQWLGLALCLAAGLAAGLCASPLKLMKSYKYEHWALISALAGMLLGPWLLAWSLCPNLAESLTRIPLAVLLKANACSLAWGVANALVGLCLVRIGFSLATGILTGVGLPVGMLFPLLAKGTGEFANAPSLISREGFFLTLAAATMAGAVVMMAAAGFAKEKALPKGAMRGSFMTGLIMSVAAGFLQVGLSFAFVYSQGPIVAALNQGAASSAAASTIAVWALALPGGALVNALFPLFLIARGRTWGTLLSSSRDFLLSLLMAALFLSMFLCMGSGMLKLGALGASLGFGIYQGVQILSAQGVGIATGEWRSAGRRPKLLMLLSISLIVAGIAAMAFIRRNHC